MSNEPVAVVNDIVFNCFTAKSAHAPSRNRVAVRPLSLSSFYQASQIFKGPRLKPHAGWWLRFATARGSDSSKTLKSLHAGAVRPILQKVGEHLELEQGPPALGSALGYLEKASRSKIRLRKSSSEQVTSHKRFTNAPQVSVSELQSPTCLAAQ